MASFWFWLVTIIGSLIGGAVLFSFSFFVFTFFRDALWMKKGLPKKSADVQEFIKQNPDKFDKTSVLIDKSKLNQEEEKQKENARRKKFREFEKLRRAFFRDKGSPDVKDSGRGADDKQLEGNHPVQRDPLFQASLGKDGGIGSQRADSTKPRVKLDD